jgi:hypothetical protein
MGCVGRDADSFAEVTFINMAGDQRGIRNAVIT